jgi:hypothetical protein
MSVTDDVRAILERANRDLNSVHDFAAPNATVFYPDIVRDAAGAGLRYAVSLEAAVADLRAAGEIL